MTISSRAVCLNFFRAFSSIKTRSALRLTDYSTEKIENLLHAQGYSGGWAAGDVVSFGIFEYKNSNNDEVKIGVKEDLFEILFHIEGNVETIDILKKNIPQEFINNEDNPNTKKM